MPPSSSNADDLRRVWYQHGSNCRSSAAYWLVACVATMDIGRGLAVLPVRCHLTGVDSSPGIPVAQRHPLVRPVFKLFRPPKGGKNVPTTASCARAIRQTPTATHELRRGFIRLPAGDGRICIRCLNRTSISFWPAALYLILASGRLIYYASGLDIPLILVSGSLSDERAIGSEHGAADYLRRISSPGWANRSSVLEKEARKKAEGMEENFHNVLDSLPDGVLLVIPTGCYARQRGVEKTFGYRRPNWGNRSS